MLASEHLESQASKKSKRLNRLAIDVMTLMESLPQPETSDLVPSEAEAKILSHKPMNSTAYRIFKLLQWLMQSPLSVTALNRAFISEPRIGKPVSNDSIWLYINTLKALGCRIRRPSPKNNFQYEMLGHPFGLMLSVSQMETLSQVKAFAQQHFTHQEMRTLDSLFKKLVLYSAYDDPQQVIQQLFSQNRSFDFDGLSDQIAALEKGIVQKGLLEINYVSPLKGPGCFCFLPDALFYEQGVLYVRGERPEYQGPSSLRVDRISELHPVEDEALVSTLLARKEQAMAIKLHVLIRFKESFTGFGLGENQGVYQESMKWISKEYQSYYEVHLRVRDVFYLKQRLLSCGLPFRVVAPDDFRKDMQATLQSMLLRYQQVERKASHGHC